MIEEALESTGFWILSGIGYAAFALMYIVLKKMGNADIMPWWVKLAVLVVIPIVAMLLSGYAEGN